MLERWFGILRKNAYIPGTILRDHRLPKEFNGMGCSIRAVTRSVVAQARKGHVGSIELEEDAAVSTAIAREVARKLGRDCL